jgi:hypothetical protein
VIAMDAPIGFIPLREAARIVGQKMGGDADIERAIAERCEAGEIATTRPPTGKGDTLKDRAQQMSIYLERPVYEKVREIGYFERIKLHALILEGVDLVLKKRGTSIKELMKKKR